jgi:hypothetical protein
MIRGSLEDMTIVSIDVFNIRMPKFIKQILTDLKREVDSNKIALGNFNSPMFSNG